MLFIQNAGAQCFEIESIFIDACGGQEGLNEMVRFKVGPAPLNVGTLNVNWPNNPWQGLVQNATTATKVADLNADIVSLGGCAELLEPTGGILPANATVILVTSFNMDTTQNSFGALTEDIYILFQNNSTTTTGHFANFGIGNRTLTMNFGGCFDSVTYDRSQLINSLGINAAGDGATVLFTPSGNATYTNYGCFAPVPPFIVDILTSGMTICAGETISLSGSAEGYQTLTWSASTGSFTNVNSLATSFTIPSNASGTIIITLTAVNSCGLSITDTVSITITNPITPNFATSLTLCNGETAPTLNTTSPNGIVGTWSPSTINNTMSGNYVFTPNPNQCATPITLAVTITNSITPDFATTLTLCNGFSAPTLNTTSPNGISGTWSPSTINNTISGNYVFTPNPNQCATPIMLAVTINTLGLTITGIDTLCVGQSTLWTPSITGGIWSSNNTTVATIDSNGNITALASGTTTLNYFIQGSCDTTISKTVTVVNPPAPSLSNLFVCLDNMTGEIISPVLLESGVSSTDYSFVWTLNGDLLPTTQNAHLASEIGIYTVTATHVLTGCSGSSTATITGSSIALATASVGIDFQLNQTITISITGGSGQYVFSLNNGPFQTLPYFNNVLQGENSIVVKDINGCGDLVLTVYALKYPPFFTPNSDGFNDTWNINGLEDQPSSLIYIFDRYGKLLKTLKASGGNGWDGTYNGTPLPATDYWFTLMYTNREGLEKEFKAHFSLKR